MERNKALLICDTQHPQHTFRNSAIATQWEQNNKNIQTKERKKTKKNRKLVRLFVVQNKLQKYLSITKLLLHWWLLLCLSRHLFWHSICRCTKVSDDQLTKLAKNSFFKSWWWQRNFFVLFSHWKNNKIKSIRKNWIKSGKCSVCIVFRSCFVLGFPHQHFFQLAAAAVYFGSRVMTVCAVWSMVSKFQVNLYVNNVNIK